MEHDQETPDMETHEANKKLTKVAAKGAANVLAPGVGGKVVDTAAKTKIGSDILDTGSKIVTDLNKRSPMGGMTQDVINKADDSGLLDAAESATDIAGGDVKPDAASSLLDLGDSKDKSSSQSLSSSEILKLGKGSPMTFIWLYMAGFFVVIILIMLMHDPNSMLEITDRSGEREELADNISEGLSQTEIEEDLIYIGDGFISELQNILNNENITFITEGNQGYDWLINAGRNLLNNYLTEEIPKYVVTSLGINDLDKIDNYINAYNELMETYDKTKFYFMGINPTTEDFEGLDITKEAVDYFNNKLAASFPDNFINNTNNNEVHDNVVGTIKKDSNPASKYPLVFDSNKLENLSLIDAIGVDRAYLLEEQIYEAVESKGRCTPDAVVAAADTLIRNLHLNSYHLPYYPLGSYVGSDIIDFDWGAKIADVNHDDKVYSYHGLDSSGFVAWALKTAGINSQRMNPLDYMAFGEVLDYNDIYPGALLVGSNHVGVIVEKINSNLVVAESAPEGVQFKFYSEVAALDRFVIVDMVNYYEQNCDDRS